MKLPNQSGPVSRNQMTSYSQEVNASGIACNICKAGCALIPNPIAKAACLAICNRTVC